MEKAVSQELLFEEILPEPMLINRSAKINVPICTNNPCTKFWQRRCRKQHPIPDFSNPASVKISDTNKDSNKIKQHWDKLMMEFKLKSESSGKSNDEVKDDLLNKIGQQLNTEISSKLIIIHGRYNPIGTIKK